MRSSSESSPPAAWPVLDTCSIAALDEDNADSIAWARTAAVVVPGRGTAGAMAAPDVAPGRGGPAAATPGTRRGLRTSFSNSDGGGASAADLTAALADGSGRPMASACPHEHTPEPSTLYRSHRPQATPSSISMAMRSRDYQEIQANTVTDRKSVVEGQ